MKSRRERTPFGQRMLDSREAAGLTQKEVCATLHLSQSTMSELEAESSGSSLTTSFAKLYGVDAHWLATGEGSVHSGSALSADAVSLAAHFDKMGPGERARLQALMRAAADLPAESSPATASSKRPKRSK